MANNPSSTLSIMESPKESLAESSGLGIKKELIRFYSLFALTVFFVYYAPPIFNKAYFIVLLAFFWKSKRDYFWFAFVLVIIQQPGTLFHGGLATDMHRVPMYNVAAGTSFNFYDLFFITAFAKAITKGKKTALILNKPLFLLLCYLIFLVMISVVLGTSIGQLICYARLYTTYTLFISLPFLVYKKEEYFQFMHLLFPIVFVICASQVFTLLNRGWNFESFFLGSSMIGAGVYKVAGVTDFIRPSDASDVMVLLCFICSLFFLEKKDYQGSRVYLYFIIAASFLIIFVSATRSFIVMFTAVFFLYSVVISKLSPRFFVTVLLILAIFFASYLFVPKIKYAVENSVRRTSTLISLTQRDLSLGGTSIRLTERLPKVLNGIKQSPIIGWGISDTYARLGDYHVANFNLILQAGIIGLLFFINLWVKYFRMVLGVRRQMFYSNSYRMPLLVLAVGFAGMLLLQLTTYQLFGFTGVSRYDLFIIIFFIVLSEFMVRYGIEENKRLKRLQKKKCDL